MDRPQWWTDLSLGRFEQFDTWLMTQGLDAQTLSGLPPFEELLAGDVQAPAAEGPDIDSVPLLATTAVRGCGAS